MKRSVVAFLAALFTAGQVFGADPIRPDPILTPGDTMPITQVQACTPGYSATVRNVSAARKRLVYQRYKIRPRPHWYEIDHLIPLMLGGSNTVENLWPQAYRSRWNARVKDRLEIRLHRLNCQGVLSLDEAQRVIRTDWIAAYQQYVGHLP